MSLLNYFFFPNGTYKSYQAFVEKHSEIFAEKYVGATELKDNLGSDSKAGSIRVYQGKFYGSKDTIEAIASRYQQATIKDKTLQSRISFAAWLSDENDKIKQKINQNKTLSFFQKLKYKAELMPTWQKALLLGIVTVVLAAIAVTGVGALAGLGMLGSTLAGLAIAKTAAAIFSIVAIKLSVSTFILAAVTTAVSGFLAMIGFRELFVPGDSLRFFTKLASTRRTPNQDVVAKPYVTIFKEHAQYIPFARPMAEFIRAISKAVKERGRDKPYAAKLLTETGKFVRYLLNPAQWVVSTLDFLRMGLLRIIDLGVTQPVEQHIDTSINDSAAISSSLLRRIAKGTINFVFEVVLTPIGFLAGIINGSLNLVGGGIAFLLPTVSAAQNVKTYPRNTDQELLLQEEHTGDRHTASPSRNNQKTQPNTPPLSSQDAASYEYGNILDKAPQKPLPPTPTKSTDSAGVNSSPRMTNGSSS